MIYIPLPLESSYTRARPTYPRLAVLYPIASRPAIRWFFAHHRYRHIIQYNLHITVGVLCFEG